MKQERERTCSEYANIMEVTAGWMFAHLFNHYFGEGTLVLAGEGADSEDLKFSATEEWLRENHVSRLGVTKCDGMDFISHFGTCKSPKCVAANEKYEKIGTFFRKGEIPGGGAVALLSVFESKFRDSHCVISRKNGFGNAIDEIKPFIDWFTGENRELWVWPGDLNSDGRG